MVARLHEDIGNMTLHLDAHFTLIIFLVQVIIDEYYGSCFHMACQVMLRIETITLMIGLLILYPPCGSCINMIPMTTLNTSNMMSVSCATRRMGHIPSIFMKPCDHFLSVREFKTYLRSACNLTLIKVQFSDISPSPSIRSCFTLSVKRV